MLPIKLQDELLDKEISFYETRDEDYNEVIFSKRSPLDSSEDGVNLLAWDVVISKAVSLERIIANVERQYWEFNEENEIAKLREYFNSKEDKIKKSEITTEVTMHRDFLRDLLHILKKHL